MLPFLGLLQIVAGAAGDNLLLVADVIFVDLFDVEEHRFAISDGHHVHVVVGLQVGVFIEVFQYFLGIGILFYLYHGAHAVAVRLIADVADAAQYALVGLLQVEDFFQHSGLVYLIGKLGDDDGLFAAAGLLYIGLGPHHNLAAASLICLADALSVDDEAAGREVRPFEMLHQAVQRDGGVFYLRYHAIDGLGQIVRWHVGGQTHGDAHGAVDQKVGVAAGQHVRLFHGVVKVEGEGHGVLFNVAQQFQRQRSHSGLGIAHGGGIVAVH